MTTTPQSDPPQPATGETPVLRVDEFQVDVRDVEAEAWVHVTGEVDIATAPRLGAAIDQTLARSPRTLYLAMDKVSFIDSSGISVLVAGDDQARRQGCRLVLHAPTRAVRRSLSLTGLIRHLTVEG